MRYTSTGALDTTFGNGGKVTTPVGSENDFVTSVVLQSDGKIVVAGSSQIGIGTNYDFALVRYTSTGALDTTFGNGGKVITPIGSDNDEGFSVAVQRDGKIVVAGYSLIGSNYDFALVRYTSTGVLDTTFGNGGKVTTPIGSSSDDRGSSVAVQSDGKIVVAGYFQSGVSNNDFAVVRYTSAGALDASFGGGTGKMTTAISAGTDQGHSVALQSDGNIVVGGSCADVSGYSDFALVRYLGGPLLPTITTGVASAITAGGAVLSGMVDASGADTTVSFEYGLTTTYGSTTSATPLLVTGNIATAVSAAITSLTPGTTYHFRVKATSSAGTSYGENGTFTTLTADADGDGLLDSWELAHFGTTTGHDALGDFDGDGHSELLELAFGSSPTVADASLTPMVVNEAGYLTITLTKQPGAVYTVQTASDPSDPSFSAATTTVLLDSATTLKVRDNVPVGASPRRFLRVRVTAAP